MRDYPILHLDTNINEHERVSNITLGHNESKETACSKKRYKCKWTWETIQYNT